MKGHLVKEIGQESYKKFQKNLFVNKTQCISKPKSKIIKNK